MKRLWHRHRGRALVFYVTLVLALLILVVPYLIPLRQDHAEMPVEALTSENGRFLDINGVSIYIEEATPPLPRDTIVFLHGFGGSTFSWRHNVPFFASHGYRIISLDMKGFGLSYKDFESDYSHPAQAIIVAEVLSELDVERAYFVGHSMGTSVMLHFAHLYPDRVIGLISVAGAVTLHERSSFPHVLLHIGPFRRTGEVFLTHYMTKERINAILASAHQKDTVASDTLDGYYNRIVSGQWQRSLLAMTRDMHKNTIAFPLEDIALPTMILWGENDSWITMDAIARWKGRMPLSEFQVIPGAGHLPMEEQPELFNDMVLSFLGSRSKEEGILSS